MAGDIVLEVDGEEITGQPQWDVIMKIRGPADSLVTLTVLHPEADEPVDIEIKRGRIDIESVLWMRVPETNLAYLQITQFAGDTSSELRLALDEINATRAADSNPDEAIEGIILDLRNNPGGFLQEALRVGNEFLENEQFILHERDATGDVRSYSAFGSGTAMEIPMVVMINEGSASAAEIVAGALQQNDRAKLIGETTLGTGTVLRPFELSDGSILRLGVTHWLMPNYDLIKNRGVQPNVMVEQSPAIQMLDSFTLRGLSKQEMYRHEDRQFRSAFILLRLQVKAEAEE